MQINNTSAKAFLFSTVNTSVSEPANVERINHILEEQTEWTALPLFSSSFMVANNGYSLLDSGMKRTIVLPDVLDMLYKMFKTQEIAVVKYEENHYGAEAKTSDGTYVFTEYCSNNGRVKISRLVDEITMDVASVSLKPSAHFEYVALYACIFAALCDMFIGLDMSAAIENMKDAPEETILTVSATIESAVKNEQIPVSILKTGAVKPFEKDSIQNSVGVLLAGEPKYLNIGIVKKHSKVTTIGELKNEFALYRETGWTDEEEKLIPRFDDSFPCVPEVRKILQSYTQTLDKPNRLVNYQWTGTSGYGKSTGVRNIACILNKPLLIQTCNTATETEDFQSTFVPNTDRTAAAELPVLDEDDLEFDPEGCWETITGEKAPEGITGCEVALRYAEEVRKNAAKDTSDFKYVLANYTRALEKGYIVEVQESSRIQRQGVLVGLNETALPGAMLPHMDGTYGIRHPNAMVIYTDNEGLDTCNSQDESVISRFSYKLISDRPSKDFIFARLQVATGISNMPILEKAYTDWTAVNDFCTEKMISNGAGVRELTNLVTMVDIEGIDSFLDNLICCVINKVVPEKADREELCARFTAQD